MQVSALPPLLLLLLFISLSSSSCWLGAHAAAGDHHDFMVVATSSLKHVAHGTVCSGHKGGTVMPLGNRTAWVPMNRPHGPCSSSPAPVAEAMDIVDDMLRWDQLRTSYIRRELSVGRSGEAVWTINSEVNTTSMIEKDHMPEANGTIGPMNGSCPAPASIEASDAAMSGKPGVRQTMVVDTSSDIPWVQCLPCPVPQCHLQKDPFYDPANSSTYASIPCGSRACKELGSSYGNGCSARTNSGQCKYMVNYGDGRATAGTYITDTLTLSPTAVIRNFRFGCSHAVKGSFSDQTAGVLALGGGPQSLRAQTADTYGNAFSYCIPQPSSVGFLSLGGPPVGFSPSFKRTPLIKNPRAPTFYVVRLEAITVAGKRLGVPPAAFAAGSVMDSSAVITQLPPVAYAALRAAFRSAMDAYPLAASVRNLDTCYDFTRFPKVTVPKVSLVFAGGVAILELDAASVMLDGCLAFAATPSSGSVGFIGNVQHQTYEVLYEVGAGAVGFRRGMC